MENLATVGWKIMNLSPYSPDLVPNDFHSFGAMKVHLQEKYQIDDELKWGALYWLSSQDKTFTLLTSVTFQEN
jgi:hypothetical protein